MNLFIRPAALTLFVALALMCVTSEATAQRGRGGGGGRSFGGGGGGRSPSMSRPASRPQVSRPPQMSRPQVNRPTTNLPATSRPTPNRPSTNLPNSGRPSIGNASGQPGVQRPTPNRPSTNRPQTNRPSTGRPATERPNFGGGNGTRPANPPSRGELGNFLDLDRPSGRPSTQPGRPAPGQNAASDFLQNRPTTQPARVPPNQRPGGGVDRPNGGDRTNVGNRPSVGNQTNINQLNINQPAGRPTTLPARVPPSQRPVYRPPAARPPYYRPPGTRPPTYRPPGYRPPPAVVLPVYRPGYWAGGGYRWRWSTYNQNWWAWATAGAVTGWVARGTVSGPPTYYDYGNTLYYEGDNVVYNNEVVATSTEYAEQAQAIATSIPEDADPESTEWMPLGVFALTDRDGKTEDATMFLQLAVSKEGIVAGTFENSTTQNKFEVEGAIDAESQRAAWGPVGESWPIMETGIYNLTENEAGALLHFEDGQTQEWKLTRLDEPKDE